MGVSDSRQVTGYLAPLGFQDELRQELLGLPGLKILEEHDRLVLVSGSSPPVYWAQNIWKNPQRFEITSISEAVRILKGMQRNWALYSVGAHRRAQLIQEQLPKIKFRPIQFPSSLPQAPMGSWALLNEHILIAASECSSLFANGAMQFAERQEPPSRAYLKLWEALSLLDQWPGAGTRCFDAGSCPGGWTWVLQQLGAHVVSVDRSPLAPSVARLPHIEFLKRDVFTLNPNDVGPVDWFFSDVICYPQRLLEMVQKWMDAGCTKFVCTIKFQGGDRRADWAVVQALAAIPGSRICHLSHNKHELTWMKV